MSVRRTALVASVLAASASLVASPMLAVTPDVGYRVTRSGAPAGSIKLQPWVWEPDASDALSIAVGTRTRRMVVRTYWIDDGERGGHLLEQWRSEVGEDWRTTLRIELSEADLAGGSTDPDRTRYSRKGFLTFDARTLSIEDNGGLALTVVGREGRRFIIRFGARDERSGRWSIVTRFVER